MFRRLGCVLLLAAPALPVISGPDPMRPPTLPIARVPTQQVTDSTQWQLKLIRRSGDRQVALINGELVREGELVNGARVKSIGQHQVILKLTDGRPIELELPSVTLRNGGH